MSAQQDPSAPIFVRPATVDESTRSVTDTWVTPRLVNSLIVSKTCSVFAARPLELPDHGEVTFAHVRHHPDETGTVITPPDMVSEGVFVTQPSRTHGLERRLDKFGGALSGSRQTRHR
jgi:hypothetical protein